MSSNIRKRQSQNKFTNLVQQQLMSTRGEMPSMEIVADRLHLNTRTLRRHLALEGMTLSKFVKRLDRF